MFHIALTGCPTNRPAALKGIGKDTTAYDLNVTPAAIVDRWDYE